MTFTKEQLIAAAVGRIEMAEETLANDLVPLARHTFEIDLELARIALASLESDGDSEPVAFINGAWTLVYYRPPKELGLKVGDKLYAAPPSPLAPDLKELEEILDWILMLPCPTPKATYFAKRLAVVIDTCRAAMLQGGKS